MLALPFLARSCNYSYTDSCYNCVLTAVDGAAKGYCSNLDRETNQAAVSMFYKCLATAKGPDAPGNCWQCYRAGDNASAEKCCTCMDKLSSANGIHCSHCWTPMKMTEEKSGSCEACIIGKDKAKGEPGQCW